MFHFKPVCTVRQIRRSQVLSRDFQKLLIELYFTFLDKLKPVRDGEDDNDSDDDEESSDEEIIVERGRIYYSGYKFLMPFVIMVACVLVILLVIAKIVAVVMRKRGERYHMALLAATKNSIVYQKLSEDIIKPTKKESKQPKVHRYAPINQV